MSRHSAHLDAIRRASSALSARLASSAVMLVNYAILTAVLSIDDVGVFFIVMGIGQTLGAVATLGLPDALIPISARTNVAGKSAITGAVIQALTLIIVTFLILFALGAALPVDQWLSRLFGNPTVGSLWKHIWWLLVAYGLVLFVSQILLSLGRRELAILTYYSSSPLLLLATLVIGVGVGHHWELRHVLGVFIGAMLLTAGIGSVVAVIGLMNFPFDCRQSAAKALLKLGLPMMGTRVTIMIEVWAPIWIAGVVLSTAGAGSFGAALRLLGGVLAVTQVVNFVSRPIIAELAAKGFTQGLEAYCRLIATSIGAFMLVLTIACFASGAAILGLVFGQAYTQAATVLTILAIGYTVQWLTGSVDVTLMMTGHELRLFKTNALWVFVTVALTLCGMLLGGAEVGAAAFSLALAAKFVLLLWIAKQVLDIWSLPTLSSKRLLLGLEAVAHTQPLATPRARP